jgi:hypothetical protein
VLLSKWSAFAQPTKQEDRDAAAAAEREEKRRLELQRQQDEQQAQEQELQQLQVTFSTPCAAFEFSDECQATIDALQAKLDKKTRDADNSACTLPKVLARLCYKHLLLQCERRCGNWSIDYRRKGCASSSWWRSSSSNRRL